MFGSDISGFPEQPHVTEFPWSTAGTCFLRHPSLVLTFYLTFDSLEPDHTDLWEPGVHLLPALCFMISSRQPEIGPGGIFTPRRSPSATNQVVVVFVGELVDKHLLTYHFLTCSSWNLCTNKSLSPSSDCRSALNRTQTKRSTYLLHHFGVREKHLRSHLRIARLSTW